MAAGGAPPAAMAGWLATFAVHAALQSTLAFPIPRAHAHVSRATTTAWLLPGPRIVAGLTFDVHTLLYAGVAILVDSRLSPSL